MMVEYTTDREPTAVGVYACQFIGGHGLIEDVFLIWHNARWNRLGSDQPFREQVAGWIGPLPRVARTIQET